MSKARFFPAIALSAIVTGTLVAGLTLSRHAHANTPGGAVCTAMNGYTTPKKSEEWMNEQIVAGRTRFVTTYTAICAW